MTPTYPLLLNGIRIEKVKLSSIWVFFLSLTFLGPAILIRSVQRLREFWARLQAILQFCGRLYNKTAIHTCDTSFGILLGFMGSIYIHIKALSQLKRSGI